mgnify:CR=1 FL=1
MPGYMPCHAYTNAHTAQSSQLTTHSFSTYCSTESYPKPLAPHLVALELLVKARIPRQQRRVSLLYLSQLPRHKHRGRLRYMVGTQ